MIRNSRNVSQTPEIPTLTIISLAQNGAIGRAVLFLNPLAMNLWLAPKCWHSFCLDPRHVNCCIHLAKHFLICICFLISVFRHCWDLRVIFRTHADHPFIPKFSLWSHLGKICFPQKATLFATKNYAGDVFLGIIWLTTRLSGFIYYLYNPFNCRLFHPCSPSIHEEQECYSSSKWWTNWGDWLLSNGWRRKHAFKYVRK